MPRAQASAGRLLPGAACAAIVLLALLSSARAGGPRYVAGSSFFDPGLAGTPITWAEGSVSYYTDQGALSPVVDHAMADSLVADAFSRWTSIPAAAVAAQRDGQLDEDVNGSNVTLVGGVLTLPADIQETATGKPVGVVYDADGQVTDALLGSGAGSPDLCAFHAAYGGPDNFRSDGHFAHALVVLNGNCARSAGDLPLLRYQLARALGRVLGLDWSQLNDNVLGRDPAPTPADWAGFPLMHPVEPECAGPITNCLPDAEQPRLDDRAALSRLYPVTAANLSRFPGKKLFYENTARIRGRVRFTAPGGGPGQDMQGVNVVARWIDPATGQPSRQQAAASVAGFLFCGNDGNPATGYSDALERRFDRFGSDQAELEGFFDLAGLEIPEGSATANYELSVEGINPEYHGSVSVGPYWNNAVTPSGAAAAVVVTALARGSDVEQDFVMAGGASESSDAFEPHSYAAPTPVPAVGEWVAVLAGYGDPDYYSLPVEAGRTLAVEVLALDDAGGLGTSKANPVIGLWYGGDPEGSAPRASATYFNVTPPGATRLAAPLGSATTARIGIFDYRGDGRPDFRYQARVLYGDTVAPARASVLGGAPVAIRGMGFHVGTTVSIGGVEAPVLSLGPKEIVVSTPALADGPQSITLADSQSGATAEMTGALSYGAAAGDQVAFLGSNGATPVGGQAANPVRARVTQADGTTPVAGASVTLSATPSGSIFSACGDVSCRLVTDASGEVSTLLTVKSTGTITLRATLATGAQASSSLSGTQASLAVSALAPPAYAATNAAVTWSMPVRVLSYGNPSSGRQVRYTVTLGSGSVSPSIVTSGGNGEAASTLTVSKLTSRVQVGACLYPAGTPCTQFILRPVADTGVLLQKVAGEGQIVNVGQSFQPLVVRVTDTASPANPVRQVAVTFEVGVARWQPAYPPVRRGDDWVGFPTDRVVVAAWTATAVTDDNGLATLPISLSSSWGAVDVGVRVVAGSGETSFALQALWPPAVPQ